MSLCLPKHHAMKTYVGVEVYRHAFLTSALEGGECTASLPGRFTPPVKGPRYPRDRRLDGPHIRSGRDGEEKNSQSPPGIEPPTHDRPARSQSLYRHHVSIYPFDSFKFWEYFNVDSAQVS
jgi:hypothetical protein